MLIETSSAKTASAGSSVFKGKKNIAVMFSVTGASGTNPTLDVKVQVRDRSQNVWVDVPGAAFVQATGATTAAMFLAPHLADVTNKAVAVDLTGIDTRLYWTIGGTDTPTFTFSIAVITQE